MVCQDIFDSVCCSLPAEQFLNNKVEGWAWFGCDQNPYQKYWGEWEDFFIFYFDRNCATQLAGPFPDDNCINFA